jgi:CubicO group peptidase (beta-lactamase class C family)
MATTEGLDAFLESLVAHGPPGAVLLVMRDGAVANERAAGMAQIGARGRPMRADMIFDLGSITKIAVTTAVVMALVERRVLDLEAPVSCWLDGFTGGGKERVTLTHLLTHRAGLWEWWPVYVTARERAAATDVICSLALRYPVDSARHYSDLSFMLLGEVACRATGEELDRLAARLVFEPLGMGDACFRPPGELRSRIAATSHGDAYERRMIATGDPYPVEVDASRFDRWREHTLVGEVNDCNAHHAFGGVAGHAGLFSSARDLARFGQALAGGGTYRGTRVWNAATVDLFTREHRDPGQGLGFWARRLQGASGAGVGHAGFPGTELLVVPDEDLIVVLLTNRLHARGRPLPLDPAWHKLLRLISAPS